MRKKESSGSGKLRKGTEPAKSAAVKARAKARTKSPENIASKGTKPLKNTVPKHGTKSPKNVPKERHIPEKIVPTKLADYLEIMTIAAFQAGVSWSMIQDKWQNFRHAFAKFDPAIVSIFTQTDIDRLMQDPGIMRSEKKILGTIENARVMLEMESKHGGFQNYLRSFDSYEKLSADIQKRFKYIGEMSVYYFLFRVNEKVPPFDPWITTIEGDHPRMREMVEQSCVDRIRS